MKRPFTILALLAAFAVLLPGCSREPFPSGDIPSIAPDGTYRARIDFALPEAEAVPSTGLTRALPYENAVADLWILQFDAGASPAQLVHSEYTTDTQAQGGGTLRIEATLKAGAEMQVILVANTHDQTLYDASALPEGSTLAQFEAISIPVTAAKGECLPSDDSPGLPMVGNTGSAGIALPTSNNIVSLDLRYAVAKLTLKLNLDKLPSPAVFTPKSACLMRVPTDIGTAVPATGSLFPAADDASFRNYDAVAITGGSPSQFTWYMAPNLRGKGTATSPRKKTDKTAQTGQGAYCTYVEVSGEYKSDPSAEATEVNYRFWPGENDTDDYNIQSGIYYELTMSPTGVSSVDGRVETHTDGFSLGITGPEGDHDNESDWMPVYDHTSAPANCYIGHPGYKILFDASKKPRPKGASLGGTNLATNACSDTESKSLSNDVTPASVEIVWQTAANHGKIAGRDITKPSEYTKSDMIVQKLSYNPSTGICTVITHSTGTGNAVLAGKSADGTVVWNWHIWVTEGEVLDNVVPGNPVNGNGLNFMDRNLGALAATTVKPAASDAYKYFGTMYQWGRKEPFTGQGPSQTANIPVSIFDGEAKLIVSSGESATPTAGSKGGFATHSSYASSMYACLQDPTLLYNYSGTVISGTPATWSDFGVAYKSLYDPCPYGYRVPKKGSWDDWGSSHNQYWNIGEIDGGIVMLSSWWPAAGRRADTGKLDVVARSSSLRISTYSISNAGYSLYFDYDGNLSPSFNQSLSLVLPVRCVRE